MGFYDRDYYREWRPSSHWLGGNQVVPWLAMVHVGVYVLQLVTAGRAWHGTFTDMLMLDVQRVKEGEVWRIVTALFIHDLHNWLNVVWNVLILWFFGRQMEEIYGGRKFLLLYLTAGVLGNLAWVVVKWLWLLAPARVYFGAAPAITFVLTLCTLHYPRQTVLLFFVLPVPLWLITLLYVGKDAVLLLQQLGGLGRPSAVLVHLTGAAFALAYYFAPGWHWRFGDWKWFRKAPVRAATSYRSQWDEHLEAQADAILDKLNREGKDALTPQEWDILHRASEAYRRRR
ncbi:Rhomboid protease GluP [bacterium HR36]|nr:Rhomboid protease GluP [bacterium HR36]